MDTNKLIYLLPEMATFVIVAEEESFTGAGKKLGIAPSSISRSIAKLEQALATKLLERTTRKVRLSNEGKDVYEMCQKMMFSAKSAIEAAQSKQNDLSGVLRIAAPKAFSKQVLTPIVLDFINENPSVSVKLKVTDQFIDPVSDEVDMIIRLTNHPIEGLVCAKLAETRLILCASANYLQHYSHPKCPTDLQHHQCITLGEEVSDNGWLFTKNAQSKKIKVNGRFAVNHTEIRKEAVLRDMGISIFPNFSIQEELNAGLLVELLPDWHIDGKYQGLIIAQYTQSRFVPKQIRQFIEFAKNRFLSLDL